MVFKALKNMLGIEEKKRNILLSPIEGKAVPLTEIPDPVFSNEIMGKGVAIRPKKGRVVSPVAGKVHSIFPAKHAVLLISDLGTEILIHVGLDTVNLKGEFYKVHIEEGTSLQPGDLLLEFDMKQIMDAGYDIITPIVIMNTDQYTEIQAMTGKEVQELEEVVMIV